MICWRCPQLIQIAKRETLRIEIAFCSDAQIVLIPTLRGTTIHGNIVKHISLAHRQHTFQDDFQKVIIIVHLL